MKENFKKPTEEKQTIDLTRAFEEFAAKYGFDGRAAIELLTREGKIKTREAALVREATELEIRELSLEAPALMFRLPNGKTDWYLFPMSYKSLNGVKRALRLTSTGQRSESWGAANSGADPLAYIGEKKAE